MIWITHVLQYKKTEESEVATFTHMTPLNELLTNMGKNTLLLQPRTIVDLTNANKLEYVA